MQKRRTTRLVTVATMGGLAFVMQFFDFPLPAFPTFLKVDFSEVPALFVALLYGPWAGVGVEALKNTLHFLFKGSETGIPVGHIANFLAGSTFVVIVSFFYQKRRSVRALISGLMAGTLVMAALMAIANYYVIFPVYIALLHYPIEQEAILPLVITGIAPFNIVKGMLVGTVFVLIYLRMQSWFKMRHEAMESSAF
ncbi:MAG: Substrate-specific component RibU of riboflavin ECF transporter [Candidatus Carbobacillus altaicus]|uniref:Riboflavin transporter n=1 Tax=Candidatus Carbonibacillus altaicus TaxID=2163959 RepID=A0A2R6Y4N6_9BACL|nr:MAG: Substrate-specific component RibU of riboflavin ECF transporter [Candidatus Carbobacillus altaicus]